MSIVSENNIFINVSILGYFMNLIFGTLANVRFWTISQLHCRQQE